MIDTTIVVPCYNEEARLRPDAFVAYAQSHPDVELLFVDDGSTDGTRGVLDSMRAAAPAQISVLGLQENRGKAAAVRAGIQEGLARGRGMVGYWDADLSTPLDAIGEFRRLLLERPEVALVMGARVKLLGRRIERLESRHYLGRFFATAVSLVLRLPVYDTQCGAKLFRATAETAAVFATPFRARWIFDVEILARMIRYRAGAGTLADAVLEHPLVEWRHVRGSKLRSADFLVAARDLAVIHREYLRRLATGREKPSIAEKQEKEGGVGERQRPDIKM
jgi:glycosyltransferase involved in cell wall biosynthesis